MPIFASYDQLKIILKLIEVIFNCDLKYQNKTCQPAAWQKVQNGWLEKANSHFIPLEKGKF